MPPQVGLVPAQSDPIKLSPGVQINGKVVTEAVVRLLTRANHKAAQKEPNEDDREDVLLCLATVRLGDVTDQSLIGEAISFLTTPDIVKLRAAVGELEAKHLTAGIPPADEPVSLTVPVSELSSKPFALNPGVEIEGVMETTCRVRLLTRGQWRETQEASPELERQDLALWFAIAELGGRTKIERAWVDALLDVDVRRINQEVEALRELHAPSPKSECPNCGHQW